MPPCVTEIFFKNNWRGANAKRSKTVVKLLLKKCNWFWHNSCSVFTASGSLMSEKCKSSVLEYKSKLLMLLDDLFFLPLSILGAGPKVNGISKKIIYFRWCLFWVHWRFKISAFKTILIFWLNCNTKFWNNLKVLALSRPFFLDCASHRNIFFGHL